MRGENDKKLVEAIEKYGNNIYRMCVCILGNKYDTEDVMQDTFIKYMQKAPVFINNRCEKAWLLKVANNLCKDKIRFYKKHQHLNIDEVEPYCTTKDEKLIFEEVMSLPIKYKEVIILYYIEGYKISEISRITECTQSAARKRLERGIKLLKYKLKEEEV